jgi:hypothetical protein
VPIPAEREICTVLWRVIAIFKAFDFSFLNYNCTGIFPRMYETMIWPVFLSEKNALG